MADTSANVTLPNGVQATVTHSTGLQNWKSLAWGLAVAIVPAAYTWFSAIDWTQFLSPNWAMFVAGVGTVIFRVLAAGPIFTGLSVKEKQ
jgi:hypothetical protein